MTDFAVRSDNVDIEQIMRQIRARIREKRGVDYTEEEIRELANVKLEKFLDPQGVRSDLLEQYRRRREESILGRNYGFEDTTIYESHRPLVRWLRKLLQPILKLFFNPNPIIDALHLQSKLNDSYKHADALYYELIHNLVLETTRLGIEVKTLKMRLESLSSRLDFDERRARSLEGVVQYRPGAVPPLQPPRSGEGEASSAEPAEHRARRRRRRGRRRVGTGAGPAGEPGGSQDLPADANDAGDERPGDAGARREDPSEGS